MGLVEVNRTYYEDNAHQGQTQTTALKDSDNGPPGWAWAVLAFGLLILIMFIGGLAYMIN